MTGHTNWNDIKAHLDAHREAARAADAAIVCKSPERVAWDDGVAWLEERRAADEEWPWPMRNDYVTTPSQRRAAAYRKQVGR